MTTAIVSVDANNSKLQVGGTDVLLFGTGGDISPIKTVNGSALAGTHNRLINGDHRVDQRYVGAAVTPTTFQYVTDRWQYYCTASSKLTLQRVADAPSGHKYSLKVTVATQYAPASTDAFNISQVVQGLNIIDFAYGLAGAVTVTLSAQVKSSITGTYPVSFRNSGSNRSYVGTYTIASANTWTPIVITLVGDTTGTWLTDTGAGLSVTFGLGFGTSFNTTAGSWQAGNFNQVSGNILFVNQTAGATWQITATQLEVGSVATAYERETYEDTFYKCLYYFEKMSLGAGYSGTSAGGNAIVGYVYATGQTPVAYVPYSVIKRVSPTTITFPTGGGNARYISSIGISTGLTPSPASYNINGFNLTVNVSPGVSTGWIDGIGDIWIHSDY